ncbi:dual specificity testis-specific protein kinase 1-like [Antedon mediterranea]|uniref:dual specificity testis-specific protein kinase 1-like n=1 Tax=Antedon mediterranea TaxID=105859 RepID=UPI003AF4E8E6
MMLQPMESDESTTDSPPSTSPNGCVQRKTTEKNRNATPARQRNSIAGRMPLSPGYGAVVSALSKLNRLDDFVLEPIAKGFFSDVSKVWHRISGEVMVLKMNTRYDNRANVIHEVELLNRLTHKNIVRFKGVCVHNGQLHALTEYMNGGDLQHILLDENVITLSWELRISLSRDVADGMNYVHTKGYIHRDLTAMNILVRKEGSRWQGIVADFGLATTIPQNNEKRSIAGSPYWMAPECLRNEFFNEKADIFSYGIILCQVIARIQADPNWLPRLGNFAVDEEGFKCLSSDDCPHDFLQLAFTCCNMEFEKRPSFEQILGMLNKMLRKIREDRANQNSVWFRNRNEMAVKKRARTSVSQLDAPVKNNLRNFPLTRSNSARLRKQSERPQLFSINSSNPFDTPELKGGQTKIVCSPRGIDADIPPKLSAMFDELDLDEEYFQFQNKDRRKSISLPTSPVLRKKLQSTDDRLENCDSPDDAKAFFANENRELTHRLISWRERKQSGKMDGSGDWEIVDTPSATVTPLKSVLRHDSGVCSLFDEETTPSNSSHGSMDDAFIGANCKRNSTGE